MWYNYKYIYYVMNDKFYFGYLWEFWGNFLNFRFPFSKFPKASTNDTCDVEAFSKVENSHVQFYFKSLCGNFLNFRLSFSKLPEASTKWYTWRHFQKVNIPTCICTQNPVTSLKLKMLHLSPRQRRIMVKPGGENNRSTAPAMDFQTLEKMGWIANDCLPNENF